MKKNILALGLAAMMLALPGCVKDTTNDLTDGAQGELVKHTFKVAMELPQNEDGSRLTLGENNAFVWEDQDEITVMGSNGSPYTAYVELNGADGARIDEFVDIFVEMPSGVTAKYAWRNILNDSTANVPTFGASGSLSDKANASTTDARLGLPLNQMLASRNLDELVAQLPMMGTVENGCIYMRNLFGIAELRVKGSGRLWSAHLFATDMELRGVYGHVQVGSTTPVWSVYNARQNYTSLSPIGMASAQLSGGLTLAGDTPTSIFIAVPVSAGTTYTQSYTHAAGELGITLRGDVDGGKDFAITKLSSKAHTFARNRITPMSITYAKPTTGEAAIDLTELGGDSNCFMVAPKGTDAHYKFRAYSNSNTALAEGCFVIPAWHTINCPVKDLWYEGVAEGAPYIHFTVKGGTQNGSMIAAVAKGSDTKHWCTDIYHIWASDAEDQTYGGLTVLDRNIGATYAPKSAEDVKKMDGYKAAETCGFYYQWGRQTPFASPITLDGSKSNATKYGWENGKTKTSGNSNFVVYKALPWNASGFTAYPNTSKTVGAYKDHLMQTMHCTNSSYKYQWALDLASPISGNTGAWVHSAKGPQDPCPQGYRVATHDELIKIFRYPNGSTGGYMMYRHWDIDQSKWILAGKYESADMVQGETAAAAAVNEYGGYHQSTLTGDNFVWVAYSGIRYGANGAASISKDADGSTGWDLGALRWAGYAPGARIEDSTAKNDKGGRFYMWGVPSEANMTNASLKYYSSPSWTTDLKSSYTTPAVMPFAPTMMMRNSGNVYDQNIAYAFDNALPVRCVKIEQADAAL